MRPRVFDLSARLAVLAAVAAVTARATPAQQGSSFPINGSDFVDAQLTVFAATGTNYDGMLGICVDNSGHFYVSSRRAAPGTAHRLFEFDASGRYVASYAQPPGTAFSAWGIRDMALDETNDVIYGGLEKDQRTGIATVYAFDAVRKVWQSSRNVTLNDPGIDTIRALAFDARSRTFYAANFGSSIATFDPSGARGPSLPSVSLGVFGAAFDAEGAGRTGSLWLHSHFGSRSMPNGTNPARRMHVIEVDLVGNETGHVYTSDHLAQSPNDLPFAGGAVLQSDAAGRYLVQLSQGDPTDGFVRTRLVARYGAGCGPTIGYAGGHPWGGNSGFTVVGQGLTEPAALVMVGVMPGNSTLPGLVACPVLLSLPIADLFPATVVGSTASLVFPVPAFTGSAGAVYFQIAEVGATLPVKLSDGLAVALIP